ncbi:MAG: hypothetical protein J3K34DRAFT_273116 [Monoraphidium minutum]|nr:MAG: hypothetical protein J3K34DRAFT_273116 [Monoraphidium minutum]
MAAPAAAATMAACLLLLLAAAPRAASAAACGNSVPFNVSSFRLAFKSTAALHDARTRQPWRRYCFALSKQLAPEPWEDWAAAGTSYNPEDNEPPAAAAARCRPPDDRCCTTDSRGPAGLSTISVSIDPACVWRGGAAGDALSKAWWSFGPRSSHADARLLKSRVKRSDSSASRPSFELTLRPGEGDAWTETEVCVNLWGELPPCACTRAGRRRRWAVRLACCRCSFLVAKAIPWVW